jgi:hypothetical protein
VQRVLGQLHEANHAGQIEVVRQVSAK